MSDDDQKKYLTIAKEAAICAGKFLSESPSASRKINEDLIHDVKIEADIQSEKLILDFLKQRTSFSILSEEAGMGVGRPSELTWIVDPVDGSLNYSRNLPMCCLSIGLWKNKAPLLGVIYDFNRNELFSGIANGGAWLNGHPISVSTINEKKNSILLTGFPVKTDFSTQRIKNFVDDIQSYKKVRLLGSAALSIAYVAAGRVEAYSENDIMLWDVAGGIPIVLGAGGKINLIQETDKQNCYNVFLTNGMAG